MYIYHDKNKWRVFLKKINRKMKYITINTCLSLEKDTDVS